ncbi:MAG: hypothetical protein KGQ82_09950, partial [Alphaproteobacteria bacterium]|nr:hypothetical protein [Alphaproteobacteria bacterium]
MADPTLTPSSTATAPVHAATLARPMKMLIAGGVLTGIAVSLIAAVLLIHLHANATEHTQQTLLSLDIVLAEQTERSLDEVDLTLKDTLSLLLQQRGAVSAQTIRAIYGGHAAAQLLRAEAGGIPQLISISIFDARGGMVNSSEPNAPANLDISFRKYFQRARDNRTPVRFISEPITFQTGMPAILMVRRLEAPDGSFAGLIDGVIPLDYFTRLYHDIYLGPGTAVSLFQRDGLLLARYPALPAIGTNVANEVSFPQVLAHHAAGVTHSSGHILGTPLFVATHALNDLPLAVNVIMTDKRAYAEWRNELVGIVIALAVILGMIALL